MVDVEKLAKKYHNVEGIVVTVIFIVFILAFAYFVYLSPTFIDGNEITDAAYVYEEHVITNISINIDGGINEIAADNGYDYAVELDTGEIAYTEVDALIIGQNYNMYMRVLKSENNTYNYIKRCYGV